MKLGYFAVALLLSTAVQAQAQTQDHQRRPATLAAMPAAGGFLLTTAFNLHFTNPMKAGKASAEGRWVSGKRRVFVAEARIVDSSGEECARGTGTFLRSHIALAGLSGYRTP